MSNDITNFNVLTRLLVEMAAAVKLKHCEPIDSQPKAFCTMYSQESHDLTCLCYMWPLPFDRHSNRLTVHACTITKGSMVYFYWGLIHRLVWHPSVLGRSVNSSKFPGQADSWRGITTGLAAWYVCFHRWLFANPVKPHECITGPVGPLGSTNQYCCGVKLLTMFI